MDWSDIIVGIIVLSFIVLWIDLGVVNDENKKYSEVIIYLKDNTSVKCPIETFKNNREFLYCNDTTRYSSINVLKYEKIIREVQS